MEGEPVDLLSAIPWETIGPSGLLTLAVLLIIRGDLVPRRVHEAVVNDRDHWREIALQAMSTNAELIEPARTSAHVIQSIPQAGESNDVS